MSTDSYKYSHWQQMPPGAEGMMSYIEARAGKEVVFFGLQMFIKDYQMHPFTMEDINEAELFCNMHGEPFNRYGWEYILNVYNGYMPVVIKAVPEGMVIPNRNVLATIWCTDPECFWVASFLETALLRGIWYPTTVATNSYECKQVIKKYMELTSDNPTDIMFRMHDFGARGVSLGESAGIGGCAHLVNFMGSDTVEGILYANRYYGCASGMAGYSIPAAEHASLTPWGKENERAAYLNMINKFGGPGKIFAVVSDSWNILNACDIWGSLKDELIKKGGTLVVRPDSGDPSSTVVAVVERLMENFGYTTNSKGFKVLPDYVRVIQGDGITRSTIEDIYSLLRFKYLAADNVSVGQGGGLLQHVNRDTYGFAQKMCAIKINDEWQDVWKEAPGKNSKRGQLSLYTQDDGSYITLNKKELEMKMPLGYREVLNEVFYLLPIGKIPYMKEYTFDEVRFNSNK